MSKQPEEMSQAELADFYYSERHDLVGEPVPTLSPAKLDVMFSVRVSTEEAAAIRAGAGKAGLSVSAFMRQVALSAASSEEAVDLERLRRDAGQLQKLLTAMVTVAAEVVSLASAGGIKKPPA
ncbi:plasmid mobilization protein [Actinoplanes sp. NPDC048796]|uniref:plasmid mobilization protein n=1 Tax=unclassified Actinoplanes TaxID=2626549 RepID=UPI0033F62F0B